MLPVVPVRVNTLASPASTVTAHVCQFTLVTGAVYVTAHVLPLKLVTHVLATSLLVMLIPVPALSVSCLELSWYALVINQLSLVSSLVLVTVLSSTYFLVAGAQSDVGMYGEV